MTPIEALADVEQRYTTQSRSGGRACWYCKAVISRACEDGLRTATMEPHLPACPITILAEAIGERR